MVRIIMYVCSFLLSCFFVLLFFESDISVYIHQADAILSGPSALSPMCSCATNTQHRSHGLGCYTNTLLNLSPVTKKIRDAKCADGCVGQSDLWNPFSGYLFWYLVHSVVWKDGMRERNGRKMRGGEICGR
jgi:hypothetical protein